MTNLIIGNVPRGPQYFGQEVLIETIWRKLKGNNILLQAPRRYGKTGAMYQLLDQPSAPYHPIYIDVEPINSAGDFMIELLAALLRHQPFKRGLKNLLEKTDTLAGFIRDLPKTIGIGGIKVELREKTDISKHWKRFGERILGLLTASDPVPLMLIDEFPIMIGNIIKVDPAQASEFLHWFRAVRMAPDTSARFVICGSVNLVSTLTRTGLVGTVNDLYMEKVKPFDRETADRFIRWAFEEEELTVETDVVEKILELVGSPIAYQMAVLISAVQDRHLLRGHAITPTMVEEAFETDLLGGTAATSFQHDYARIDAYYPTEHIAAARALLRVMCRTDDLVSKDTLYQSFLKATNSSADHNAEHSFFQLIEQLENDFYIENKPEGCCFRGRVLRLWWQNRYGYQME